MSHVHRLLKDRERVRPDEAEWVLREALDPKKLRMGGTFQNVLSRKMYEVVGAIFAKIIALIDRNYNLELLEAGTEDTPIAKLWLNFFQNPKIMGFHYEDIVAGAQSTSDKMPMLEEFRCQLPFSWLIMEAFESQRDNAETTASGKYET